jgi:hypothetical protein
MKSNCTMLIPVIGLVIIVSACSTLRTDGNMNFDDGQAGMIYFKTKDRGRIIDSITADFGSYDTTKYKNQVFWRAFRNPDWSDTLMNMKAFWYGDFGKDSETLGFAIVDYNGVAITQRHTEKVKKVKQYINAIRQ